MVCLFDAWLLNFIKSKCDPCQGGYNFLFDGAVRRFRGTVTVVSADNLASQLIGGYKALNSAFRKCRYCMATDAQMQQKVCVCVCICLCVHTHMHMFIEILMCTCMITHTYCHGFTCSFTNESFSLEQGTLTKDIVPASEVPSMTTWPLPMVQ